MPSNYKNAIPEHSSLKSISSKMFSVISKYLNVNSVYVTRRGETAMTVLSSFNKEEMIIPEGYSVEYGGTYCRLIIMNENDTMHTGNLMKDEITKQLEVTSQLNVKGFLGVTIKDLKGDVFGTLCVMDKEEKDFSQDDINYLKSMAEIFSHMIELDQTKYNMGFLSVPIIPITKGVSILSIQGIVDENRASEIISDVLHNAAANDIHSFIIDLSKLIVQEDDFPNVLFNMIEALSLMGVETIITGVNPAFARKHVNNMDGQDQQIKFVANIQFALEYLGYSLVEK